jgi:hypothetical protein
MKMKISKDFVSDRVEYLLTEPKFIRFCKDHGLNISPDELDYLRTIELILPRITESDNSTVAYYYSCYQFYIIKLILPFYQLTFKGNSFAKLVDKTITTELPPVNIENDKAIVAIWDKTFAFLIKLDTLFDAFQKSIYTSRSKSYLVWLEKAYGLNRNTFKKQSDFKKQQILKDEMNELRIIYTRLYDKKSSEFKPNATLLCDKYELKSSEIYQKAQDFIRQGSISQKYTNFNQSVEYANSIDHDLLIKHEHPYKVVSRLIWLLGVLDEPAYRQTSFASLLLGSGGNVCAYCQIPITRRTFKQISCGSKECLKIDSNTTKKRKRKLGIYSSR